METTGATYEQVGLLLGPTDYPAAYAQGFLQKKRRLDAAFAQIYSHTFEIPNKKGLYQLDPRFIVIEHEYQLPYMPAVGTTREDMYNHHIDSMNELKEA